MSKTIDSKVVEMRFDNRQFENNVQTSMNTLGKLKKSLDLSGATKGLEEVDRAAKGIDLSGFSSAIGTVQSKFSAMEVVAITALANITTSAVTAGIQIVKSLSIDQVTAGWSKYGQKTASVQTIMNATGKSIDEVNQYLDKLMWFSDETSYGFTDMTAALGQLTSAGGDIDKLVPMITGIANATAYAGKGAGEFSRAIYNLNQSYSAGSLQYMDWKSLELAGIASKELKQTFIDTAIELGKISEGDVTIANFGQTLKDKWADTEVMEAAFGKFGEMTEKAYEMVQSGEVETASEAYAILAEKYDGVAITAAKAAQEAKTFAEAIDATKDAVSSGWMKTFELIFGNYEEAKTLWTDLANALWDAFASGAESRNEMLSEWKELGGRDDLIESFWNTWEAIGAIITPIKEAFRDIFPAMTAERLAKITASLKEFTSKLKLSDTASENLKRTFKGLFAVFDIVKLAFSAVYKALSPLASKVVDLAGFILSLTAKAGDWIVKLDGTIRKTDAFGKAVQFIIDKLKQFGKMCANAFNNVNPFIDNTVESVKSFYQMIKEKFIFPGLKAFHAFLGRFHKRMSSIVSLADSVHKALVNAIEGVGEALRRGSFFKFLQTVWQVVKTIGSAVGRLLGEVFKKVGDANFDGIIDFINTLTLSGIAVLIAKFVKGLNDIVDGVKGFKDSAIGILDSVRGCIEAYQTSIKADALKKIAVAIAILVGSILVLSFIDSDKVDAALASIAVLFGELMASMAIFTKIAGKFTGVTKACGAMISMSVAVLILASALRTVATLDTDELVKGLLGVAGLMAIIIASAKLLSGNGVIKGATQMVIFAAAVKILALACKDFASFSWEEIGKGLVGVGALMAEISIFLNTAKFSSKSITTATGIVILAAAIKILASACKDFVTFSWEEIGKGLASVGSLLLALAAFTNAAGHAKHVLSTGVALIAIAAAMKIFASAMKDMSALSWEKIGKGLITMAGALAEVVIAINLLPKNTLVKGLGLIALSTALVILSSALKKMGGMQWEEIGKGLTALGASMAILAIGLNVMKGTLAGSAALLVAVAALAALAPVLSLLGAMSWDAIARGLVAIGGALAIIGIAGYAFTPVVPAILGLAGALLLIGAAVLTAGAGLAAFGAGLTAVSLAISALAGSLSVVTTVVTAIIVAIIRGVGEGIIALCEVIAGGVTSIGAAVKSVVLTLVDVLVECVPALADGALKLIAGVLSALADYTPQIVDSLMKFIIGLIDGIARNTPALLQSIVNLVMSLAKGAMDAIMSIDPDAFIKGSLAITALAGMMAALAAVAALIPEAMVGVLGVIAVLSEFGALAQIPGLAWLIGEGQELFQAIGEVIGSFVGGIVGGFMGGVSDSFPQIAANLSAFMVNIQPFIDGAKSIDPSSLDGVNALVGAILLLTGANILEGLASWLTGGSSLSKFGEDIAAFGPSLKAYSDSVVGIDTEAIKASAGAAKALAEMASVIPNEGGIAAWFAGENSVASFGSHLPILGAGLKGFSDAVSGIIPENIIAASNAAKALAEMTNAIPNEGGVVSWFAGDNSISKFAGQLPILGAGLKGFSDAISGIVPENIIAATNAAKVLADMTNTIPNEGGIASWFAGENSVSKFSNDIVCLGTGLKCFSDAIAGIVPENIVAASNAAKSLAEMTNTIPNEGGIVSWFAGENSISKFASQLPILGAGLKGFSDAVAGIVPENVVAASNAAKTLAAMTNTIPNEGGVVSWFTGENSMLTFATRLPALGSGLKGFSDAVAGIVPENVVAASNAAKTLAQMTATIPKEGGIKAWFAGETSVANFADKLPMLGGGLKGFSDSIEGIVPENVTAAANAAKALAEMAKTVPNEGGIKAWFSGKSGVATFAYKLPTLGDGLKGFSDSVEGIVPANVTAAANAAKSLGEMTATIPKNTDRIVIFGDNLIKFGDRLSSFFSNTSGISSESITAATKAVESVEKMASVESGNIKSLSSAIQDLVKSVKSISSVSKSTVTDFNNTMKSLGESGAKGLLKGFKSLESDMKKAGNSAIESFVKGVKGKLSSVESGCKSVTSKCTDTIKTARSAFEDIGSYLVSGFASGISQNTYKAVAQAKAMAAAAIKAAKAELDEHSPSKVGYKIGDYFGLAFVNAIGDYKDKAYKVSADMAKSSKNGLRESLNNIRGIIDGNIDAQPAIRPVLDLSDVQAGAAALGSMLAFDSRVGVLANVRGINAMMSSNQNGTNEDIISAIKDLGGKIDRKSGDVYNINGITYDDGSNIADAVEALVRAARVERRI